MTDGERGGIRDYVADVAGNGSRVGAELARCRTVDANPTGDQLRPAQTRTYAALPAQLSNSRGTCPLALPGAGVEAVGDLVGMELRLVVHIVRVAKLDIREPLFGFGCVG